MHDGVAEAWGGRRKPISTLIQGRLAFLSYIQIYIYYHYHYYYFSGQLQKFSSGNLMNSSLCMFTWVYIYAALIHTSVFFHHLFQSKSISEKNLVYFYLSVKFAAETSWTEGILEGA